MAVEQGRSAQTAWQGPRRGLAASGALALARVLPAAVYALPLIAAIMLAAGEALDGEAWRALLADRLTRLGLVLSVGIAVASTLGALAITLAVVAAGHGSRGWARLSRRLPAMLAVPHAAFAVGLAWLLAPSGWLARLVAPLAGWTDPPPWQTVQDPQGLALVAVLVLKETPFLLWNAAAMLARPDAAALLAREQALARTLGYSPWAWWWRVGWLQWLPRLAWPLLAVLAYGLTVVDLALIIGPGSPPPLAVQAWLNLSDADVSRNREGAAAAAALALVLALLVLAARALWAVTAAAARRWAGAGRRSAAAPRALAAGAEGVLVGITLAVSASLAVLALAGPWPFPRPWPEGGSWQHLQTTAGAGGVAGFSALLAIAVAMASLVLTVAWLEATPPAWDARVMPLVLAPLVLPQLLLLVGLYQGALALRLDGSVVGLAWAHAMFVGPYVFTALAPAWRAFDPRLDATARTLGRSRLAFWWRVKWPLLAAPLASALALGFAVGIAQYLSTQFIGAGRHPTLTTEAVTLASGGQRNLAAALALVQTLMPLAGFALAAWVGRVQARRV